MQIKVGARTDLGRVRSNNEDSFKLVPELNLFILSDGMGGEAHGEVASNLAVEAIAAHCLEGGQKPDLPYLVDPRAELNEKTNRLASAVQLANKMIYESAQKHAAQRGMGATVVAIWINDQRLSVAHVGDSRVYLLRSGEFQQITDDHSLVAEQVRRGILTKEQAESSDMQSVLIRALGIEPEVQVDADEHLLMEGDILVLCSDGLSRMVSDLEIASTLLSRTGMQSTADRLIELANEYGGEDNVSVVLVRVEPRPEALLVRVWRWLNEPLQPTTSAGGN
ncbi:MAG: Stp1/IreP family PP2C-type Ser/Thr phosphatase [Acidobacteria bacterium]|nr:Stp1/IreP family PP2C-type Ser/Thr phosphatase [Acidobacteriota bacterium]MBI3485226.1 Stp1/IreP family PP2C-type Ser/Thr phosphatase [Acidobacteriota bacterium]